MPRLRLKRRILLLTTLAGTCLLVVNLAYRGLELREVVKVPVARHGRDNGADNTVQQQPSVITASVSGPAPAPPAETVRHQQLRDQHRQLNYQQQKLLAGESTMLDDLELSSLPRLWFMKDGAVRPDSAGSELERMPLLAHEGDGDRIVQQLMYVPRELGAGASGNDPAVSSTPLKKILLYNGIGNWKPLRVGQETFVLDHCPVDTCEVTIDRGEAATADAILFRDHVSVNPVESGAARPPWQVWILYLLECPYHTQNFHFDSMFNWTATYRHDSDIVAPYEKFVPYDLKGRVKATLPRNYAAGKTKKVAWFVSNCAAQNGRMEYANALAKHIQVDIYGACGKHQCPRTSANRCFDLLNTDYKFYLSFENSNCKDYITEKFFVNGLGNDVLPIVMGARKEDYERAAPFHSYLHVEDFAGPEQLAAYLHRLDRNDTEYNEYFRWKGTGEFVNTFFWCRVCAALHADRPTPKVYEDMNAWWRGPGTCINRRWDSPPVPAR